MIATQSELRSIPLAEITVDHERNARATTDAVDVAMVASVTHNGVLTPIIVSPTDDGYILVAGYRRVMAAAAAGLTEIPAHIRPHDDAVVVNLVENTCRLDLNPTEEADALEAVARHTKIRAAAKLANLVGRSEDWVRSRRKIAGLGQDAKAGIATGKIPLALVDTLTAIDTSNPTLAEAVAVFTAGLDNPNDLGARPGAVVAAAARAAGMIVAQAGRVVDIKELDLPPELHAAASDALGTYIQIDQTDADAARAYGCLAELPGWHTYSSATVVTDRDFIHDRIAMKVKAAQKRGQASGKAAEQDTDPAVASKAKRDADREARAGAHLANQTFGATLAESFHKPKLTLPIAHAIASMILDRFDRELGACVRLSAPGWSATTTKTTKTTTTERVTYPDVASARQQVRTWVLEAKTAEEVLGRLLQAALAATFTDQQAVAQSDRCYQAGTSCFGRDAGRFLAALADGLLPDRLRPKVPAGPSVELLAAITAAASALPEGIVTARCPLVAFNQGDTGKNLTDLTREEAEFVLARLQEGGDA